MLVPNRHGSSNSYRYGFQGQEKDDELKGEGNSLNYTFRMHDPRVGRFFAVDPLAPKYPFYSPYQFCSNSPLMAIELEGLESSEIANVTEKMYQGEIASYEAEESKGTIPGGQSTTQRWQFGNYTIVPTYVKVNENMSVLSHYTAGSDVVDLENPSQKIYRTDWVIPYEKLSEFKEKVGQYETAAALLYMGRNTLADWQIAGLNGDSETAMWGWWKEQWSVPKVIFGAMGTTQALTSMYRNLAKSSIGTRVNTQRMKSHGHLPETHAGTKSYMNSVGDAQKVIDAVHKGDGAIMKVSTDGKVYIRYNDVSGTYMDNGTPVQTNVFYIQGIRQGQAKVVPVHPKTKF